MTADTLVRNLIDYEQAWKNIGQFDELIEITGINAAKLKGNRIVDNEVQLNRKNKINL